MLAHSNKALPVPVELPYTVLQWVILQWPQVRMDVCLSLWVLDGQPVHGVPHPVHNVSQPEKFSSACYRCSLIKQAEEHFHFQWIKYWFQSSSHLSELPVIFSYVLYF